MKRASLLFAAAMLAASLFPAFPVPALAAEGAKRVMIVTDIHGEYTLTSYTSAFYLGSVMYNFDQVKEVEILTNKDGCTVKVTLLSGGEPKVGSGCSTRLEGESNGGKYLQTFNNVKRITFK